MTRLHHTIKLVGLVASTAFLSTSCSKQFGKYAINPNQATLESYFVTPDAINSGIIGTYGYLSTPRNLGASGSKMDIMRGDEATSNSDYGIPGQYNNSLTPSWYTIVQPYSLMYTVALQATEIIASIPRVTFQDTTKRNAYLGEAHFLRAFAHFWLLIHFRNISLITKVPVNKADYLRPQVDPITAWNYIIQDLRKSEDLLPLKGYWPAEYKGRVTKGSAAALLGMVYLYETGIENNYGKGGINKYNDAAKELGDIINGNDGQYALVQDYGWNFDVAHENNDESLFEIQFKGDLVNTGFNPGLSNSGLENDARGVMLPGRGVGYEGVVHNWLYDTFAASKDAEGYTDRRMFYTLIFDDRAPDIHIPLNSDGKPEYRDTGIAGQTWEEMYPPRDGKTGFATLDRPDVAPYKAGIAKWLDLTLPATDPGNNQLWYGNPRADGVNWRYIRLAGVYLMYAEAVLDGGTQTSITPLEAVNRVRARAHMPLLSSVTLDDIKRERILELSLEGHRFFDLLRWGQLDQRFHYLDQTDPYYKKLSPLGYGPFIDNKDEWLPIPIDEIESNPGTKQNVGW